MLKMPAPSESLASGPPTSLRLTTVSVTVSVPQLSMPPPSARAKGQGPPGQVAFPESTVDAGAARLPSITLSSIDTVAPGAKPAPGGTETPPPRAATVPPPQPLHNGLEFVRPPVILRRASETVGC